MKVCRTSLTTPTPPHEALASFWDMERLQSFWDPISQVTVLHDDGTHQEARMHVHRDGHEEVIRIIRFRAGTDILFFNPQPPPMMKFHRGAWRFRPEAQGGCLITAEREYELLRRAGESDEEHARRTESFNSGLEERLQRLLRAFLHSTSGA